MLSTTTLVRDLVDGVLERFAPPEEIERRAQLVKDQLDAEPDTAWLLTDVGCLECGNETKHLGVFADRAAVEAEVERLLDEWWETMKASSREPDRIRRPHQGLAFLAAGGETGEGRGSSAVFVAFEVPA